MNISVFGSKEQWKELMPGAVEGVTLVTDLNELSPASSAIIVLDDSVKLDWSRFTQPVFINAVNNTLSEMSAGNNIVRFNGWPGFIGKKKWEMAGLPSEAALSVLRILEKEASFVEDQVGFVAPRIISMIINEAFFALEEEVSTRGEIDTAMKLGTNYPFGPFDWCARIGPRQVLELLYKLSTRDRRYHPCHLLAQEAQL